MLKKIKREVLLPRVKLLLLAVLLLASCDGTLYHRFEQVDDAGWAATDTLQFVYEGADATFDGSAVELSLQVRYAAAYKYKNLCMRVETFRVSDTTLLSIDTLCCQMYSDDGRRLGSTAGTMYQNASNIVDIAASPSDTLLLRVVNIMPEDCLPNVFDVGVRLAAKR